MNSSHLITIVTFCNKTVVFCNKRPDAFLSRFAIKCHNEPNMKLQPLLTTKIRIRCASNVLVTHALEICLLKVCS